MSKKNSAKKKIDHCVSVAKDLGEIIKFSCNDEFRQKCMSMCKVSSTYECQEVLRKKLMELTIEHESMRDKSNGRKRKVTSKPADTQITIQESFEKQKRLEIANRFIVPDENTAMPKSDSNVKRILKQPSITDMFKKQKRIQHFKSVALKPMQSVQENAKISGPDFWQGSKGTTASRELPRNAGKPFNTKSRSCVGQSLLDPNNFKWNDDKNEEIKLTTAGKEAKSMTSFHMENDALSIMSDPRIFMWNED